jgi:hypothetical protein
VVDDKVCHVQFVSGTMLFCCIRREEITISIFDGGSDVASFPVELGCWRRKQLQCTWSVGVAVYCSWIVVRCTMYEWRKATAFSAYIE